MSTNELVSVKTLRIEQDYCDKTKYKGTITIECKNSISTDNELKIAIMPETMENMMVLVANELMSDVNLGIELINNTVETMVRGRLEAEEKLRKKAEREKKEREERIALQVANENRTANPD